MTDSLFNSTTVAGVWICVHNLPHTFYRVIVMARVRDGSIFSPSGVYGRRTQGKCNAYKLAL